MPSLLRSLCFFELLISSPTDNVPPPEIPNKQTCWMYLFCFDIFSLHCSVVFSHSLMLQAARSMSCKGAPGLCYSIGIMWDLRTAQTLSICLCSFIPNDLFHFIRRWDRWWRGDENSTMLLNKWTVYESKHRMGSTSTGVRCESVGDTKETKRRNTVVHLLLLFLWSLCDFLLRCRLHIFAFPLFFHHRFELNTQKCSSIYGL